MKVKIPFLPQFKDAMLSGNKCVTTRSRKYGEGGDTFEIFGQEFMLTSVFQRTIEHVANLLYLQEGFKSEKDFIELWKKLHPRVGYQPERVYWVHVFVKTFAKR